MATNEIEPPTPSQRTGYSLSGFGGERRIDGESGIPIERLMKNKSIFLVALAGIVLSVVCLFQGSQIAQLKSNVASLQQAVEARDRRNEATEAKLKEARRERSELSFQVDNLAHQLPPLRAAGKLDSEEPTPAIGSGSAVFGQTKTNG